MCVRVRGCLHQWVINKVKTYVENGLALENYLGLFLNERILGTKKLYRGNTTFIFFENRTVSLLIPQYTINHHVVLFSPRSTRHICRTLQELRVLQVIISF